MYHADHSVATEIFVRLTRQNHFYQALDVGSLEVAFNDAVEKSDVKALNSLLREVEHELSRTPPFPDTTEAGLLAYDEYRKGLKNWVLTLDKAIPQHGS